MSQIITVFEKVGKRTKLAGFRIVFDGVELGKLYDTKAAAQRELDELTYDDLAAAGAYAMGRAA